MSEMRFSNDHEWAKLDGDTVTIGITDYAQEQLGDIVYVELPDIGRTLDQGEETAIVESVKAAGDLKTPVTGEVTEINDALEDEPELINQSPEEDGWFFKVKLSSADEFANMLDKKAYSELIESLS